MEFKELLAAFATKYGIDGLEGADGAAELDVEGIRVELLNDLQTHSLVACAEIGHPPPDANGVFGAMMLQANFLLRATDGATLCQNPETEVYALVRPFPLALADVESLAAGLESLVNQAENWRKALSGLRQAEAARVGGEDGAADEPAHHDMLSSGFFHV
ncbi:MAG: type III secretion system chaperone [Kiritimatiellae bacterium]|nr:type III secretion system chaperone [Kiritimatiellia bacterium]